MPEGDTLYRTAVNLRKALLGRTVLRFETTVAAVAAVDDGAPVAGRVVSAVEARGKHLLISFADPEFRVQGSGFSSQRPETRDQSPETGGPDAERRTPEHLNTRTPEHLKPLVLHTHLRMTGSWHLYRPGERWQKPAHRAVCVIHTDAFVAPCFSAPVVELLTERQAQRHPDLVELGPDAITAEFDPEEAKARMRRRPEVEIGVALMNQRLMAGVGNVYKSEVLFIRRLSPFGKVGELSEEALDALIAEAHRLLLANRGRTARATRFGLNERERLWVYGRSGEPCRVCGTSIRMRRQGLDGRSTYYCPECQG